MFPLILQAKDLDSYGREIGQIESDEDCFVYLLSQTSQTFCEFLAYQGFYIRQNQVHFNPTNAGKIRVEAQGIVDEYADNAIAFRTRWQLYGLRNSEDVDYNGYSILIALEIVEAYLTDNPLHPPFGPLMRSNPQLIDYSNPVKRDVGLKTTTDIKKFIPKSTTGE